VDDSLCVGRSLHCGIDRVLADSATRTNQPVYNKAKKRLEVIHKKLQVLRPSLAGSRAQADDPEELKALEDEIAKLETEAAKLKAS
jgi:hypothetical protein